MNDRWTAVQPQMVYKVKILPQILEANFDAVILQDLFSVKQSSWWRYLFKLSQPTFDHKELSNFSPGLMLIQNLSHCRYIEGGTNYGLTAECYRELSRLGP